MPDLHEELQGALAGRYTIVRELGRGGMGVVFLAHDRKHDRQVALKVLRPELAQSLGAERFLREILISARLNHPNILTLIDSGEAGGFMYYVLPFVEGESLRDRLDRESQLPIEEALRITAEVADALAYAHSMGVVHRDIKPENILFEAGHAVVTDFGIARAVYEAGGEKLTESGLAIGTPTYMSPEQALGGAPVDGRADLYSLACVLYEMLAGEPPYTGASAHAILARKAVEAVPGLRVVRDTVPAAIETAIVRAMAKVPADRFATAREFAEALAGRGPVTAPRTERRRHGLPSGRVVAAAAAIVVIPAAAYVVLALRGEARGPSPVEATFTHFTVDPGAEWFPSLSPDGQWIVYSGEASGNRDIYLRSIGGENAIDLTADAVEDDDEPAFSPDGKRIAFRSERDGGGIFVMGRTGEAVRRVTTDGYRPTWNPEGTKLAYSLENVTAYPQNSSTRSGLWVVDVATGVTRRLADIDASLPSWSPHGKRIAFLHRLGAKAQGHVWTIAADGSDPRAVTEGMTRDWSPAWSPAGDYLYFVSDRGGSMNLWRVRIDEASGRTRAAPEPVTAPGANLAHVSVSADGTHLAYSSILITTNVERSGFDPVRGVMAGQRAWVTHGSRIWADPDPSPDGRRVVFYSLVDPEGHLYVTNADGSGPLREVTGDSAVDRLPRWSPDGKWIATFSDRSGPLQIWKIRPDGSGLTRLTDVSGNVAYGVWSPDARRMVARVLRRHDWSTFLLDPNRSWAEQRITPIAKPPDSLEDFAPHSWSPDGARLAGLFNGLDKGIIVFTFATGRYERLTDFGQWPVWLPDSRRILFVSGGHTFYVIDRVTKSVHKVFTSGRDVVGPPELTPDGRTVFYTHRVTEADIWVMTLQ